VLAIGTLALVAGAAAIAVYANQASTQKYPPQFPREGATKLFENEYVIIWEQIGRPKDVFMHKHIRDIIYVVLEPGGVSVLNPDGSTGGAGFTQNIYNRPPNSVSYTKAGLGPHAELMTDPSSPGRFIFVEIKGSEPEDCRQWSTDCP
jgi:hypothetical protein